MHGISEINGTVINVARISNIILSIFLHFIFELSQIGFLVRSAINFYLSQNNKWN